MKKKIIQICIFILTLTNCTSANEQSENINNVNFQDSRSFEKNKKNIKKISETNPYNSTYYVTGKAEPWERNIQFIGKNNIEYDNIQIKKIEDSRINIKENQISEEDSIFFESKHVWCEVDTTQKVTLIEYEWWTKEREYKYYKSYPIILKNLSKIDSLTIGYSGTTTIYLQAKKENGEWVDIELPYILSCGNGVKSIYLKPNEFSISLGIIYEGDFRTKLRYRFRNFYSNEFEGKINKSQLTEQDYWKYSN